jgi:hypothetical protein
MKDGFGHRKRGAEQVEKYVENTLQGIRAATE